MTSDLHLHLIARAFARSKGWSHYFTGKPCIRGHVDYRSITGDCMQCLREKQNRRLHGDPAYRELHRKSCLKRQMRLLADPENRKRIRDREALLHRESDARKAKKSLADQLRNERNAEANAIRARQWAAENKESCQARCALRRARRLKATPSWLTKEQRLQMRDVYALSVFAQEVSGQKFHVDHIVPLKGKGVCGLHVPWNLQVIPAKDNLRKHAKLSEGASHGLTITY